MRTLLLLLLAGCTADSPSTKDADTDADTDSDADSDADTDADTDSDADTDTDSTPLGCGQSSGGDAAGPQFALSSPVLDAGSDGWSPGETATLTVTMTNQSTQDHSAYPGITLASDGAAIDGSPFWWFAMFAGDSQDATFSVTAETTVTAGHAYTFTAEADALNCTTCPDPNPLIFVLCVE